MFAARGAAWMHLGDIEADDTRPVFNDRPLDPTLLIGREATDTLVRLALDDASLGKGFAYFGDSSKLLPYLSRTQDTILFERDALFPRRFNPLCSVKDAEPFVEALGAAYPSDIPTARLDRLARLGALSMIAIGGTVYGIHYLFTSSYRERVIPQISNPDLKKSLEHLHAKKQKDIDDLSESLLNRLDPLITDEWLRNIFAQTKSFPLKDTDILIVDLPKGRKFDTLAALIMSTLKGRVYIERPHLFVGAGVPVIACKYLDQLPGKLLNELLGTATLVSFRVGVKDAKILEPEFDIVREEDKLTKLLPKRAYVRLDRTYELALPKRDFPTFKDSPKAIRNRSRNRRYSARKAHVERTAAKFVENLG